MNFFFSFIGCTPILRPAYEFQPCPRSLLGWVKDQSAYKLGNSEGPIVHIR